MSKLIQSTLAYYEQSRQEQLSGSYFNQDQREFIQNNITTISQERLALVPDPNNYAVFIQTEAHLKGQIQILQHLLDCSAESEAQLLELAQQAAE